jgi:hypothetical protein
LRDDRPVVLPQKQQGDGGGANDYGHQRHNEQHHAFKIHPDGGVACHAGGNWRGWRGRRRRLLRLQFLGLLQGVIDQAHSAWCAPGG